MDRLAFVLVVGLVVGGGAGALQWLSRRNLLLPAAAGLVALAAPALAGLMLADVAGVGWAGWAGLAAGVPAGAWASVASARSVNRRRGPGSDPRPRSASPG